jgi:hypothetical protein
MMALPASPLRQLRVGSNETVPKMGISPFKAPRSRPGPISDRGCASPCRRLPLRVPFGREAARRNHFHVAGNHRAEPPFTAGPSLAHYHRLHRQQLADQCLLNRRGDAILRYRLLQVFGQRAKLRVRHSQAFVDRFHLPSLVPARSTAQLATLLFQPHPQM